MNTSVNTWIIKPWSTDTWMQTGLYVTALSSYVPGSNNYLFYRLIQLLFWASHGSKFCMCNSVTCKPGVGHRHGFLCYWFTQLLKSTAMLFFWYSKCVCILLLKFILWVDPHCFTETSSLRKHFFLLWNLALCLHIMCVGSFQLHPLKVLVQHYKK